MLKNPKCSSAYQGVFSKIYIRDIKISPDNNCMKNVESVQTSVKANLKFSYLGITPTWNASTWATRWFQLIYTTFLDCCWHLSPGTARWPLHKDHSGNTKALKISKLWHGLKIPPNLVDLCHIYDIKFYVNYFKITIYCQGTQIVIMRVSTISVTFKTNNGTQFWTFQENHIKQNNSYMWPI